MKYLQLFCLFLTIAINSRGQKINEAELMNALNQYRSIDTLDYFELRDKVKDSLWMVFTKKFELLIQNKEAATYKFKEFKLLQKSMSYELSVSKSEDGNWILYSFANEQRFWLNYLTKAIRVNNVVTGYKIILTNNTFYRHYTQIHNLNARELLLMEQMDEFVFACNYAYVYSVAGDDKLIKKNAFNGKSELMVCNFTEWEGLENAAHPNGLYYSDPHKISFNYRTKTIYYGKNCIAEDSKRSKGSAKYMNGNFNIVNCDEREFDQIK